ncbi:hypothetical protein Ciccas_002596 [Cichlidogyrus casuarinus]|uniref:Uncharacterized protein n=1 Tax=Cichlidogyrus casuarinus TaxID=1844966 RepID=A0ABD2QGT9_9PLAT
MQKSSLEGHSSRKRHRKPEKAKCSARGNNSDASTDDDRDIEGLFDVEMEEDAGAGSDLEVVDENAEIDSDEERGCGSSTGDSFLVPMLLYPFGPITHESPAAGLNSLTGRDNSAYSRDMQYIATETGSRAVLQEQNSSSGKIDKIMESSE